MDAIIKRLKEKVTIVDNSESNFENSDTDEFISSIRSLIKLKQIVPVICEDMYEYEDPETHKRQSLHSYIIEKIIERVVKKGSRIELTESELEDIVNKGYYGFSLLQKIMPKRYSDRYPMYSDIYKLVMDENNKILEGVCLKDDVRSFLLACNFPLIITTNCFPILEKELNNNYHDEWNEIGTRNDKPLPEHCVYHIFGKANPSKSNWTYDEKQMLSYLRSTYSSDYALKNLASNITANNSRKTLLVLGNDSPDWLFRFILSPIYGGDVYDDGTGFYMSDEGRSEENSLSHFLENIHFEKETQLKKVLQKLTASFQESNTPSNISHGKSHDFFVSYASEDREKVKKFIAQLVEDHEGIKINVWYDRNPDDGIKDGAYWEKIINELKDSAYFIPFITENYIRKTCDEKTRREILGRLNIKDLTMDSQEALLINKKMPGVQTELLLAQRWLELNPQKVYSIPVIVVNEEFYGEAITGERVDNWGTKNTLPRNLFGGIQSKIFDVDNPQKFVIDWKRYKSLISKL